MNTPNNDNLLQVILKVSQMLVLLFVLAILLVFIAIIESKTQVLYRAFRQEKSTLQDATQQAQKPDYWTAPDAGSIPNTAEGELIKYGKELIAHTAKYLGKNGSVLQISNGMNCQNCHLEAGTKPYGNNYGSVAATYPKFRARSGTNETIVKRVNDCFERSLNGKALDSSSREMQAMVAYIKWLGKYVPKGEKVKGSGIVDLPFLNRAADPTKGKIIYEQKCASCHKKDGSGEPKPGGKEWIYPPLWGNNSYNQGAGLYRISRFAGYVKYNMPLGVSYPESQLTDEEAWDVAAYVNSMPRPAKDLSKDWPNIAEKPIDHPFGPFADSFDEKQHKFGPFPPIKAKREKLKEKSKKEKS
mgnify:CR=1 FL=1